MTHQMYYYNQIKNMDYSTLVNNLLKPITPDIRRMILYRLIDINEYLIKYDVKPPTSIDRPKTTNTIIHNQIDIDDIIDADPSSAKTLEKDDLDLQLENIGRLHTKILSDRRRRKQDTRKL